MYITITIGSRAVHAIRHYTASDGRRHDLMHSIPWNRDPWYRTRGPDAGRGVEIALAAMRRTYPGGIVVV